MKTAHVTALGVACSLLSFVIAEAACSVLQGSQSVLSCTWNKPATKLFVGSVDHNLRVFGPPTS